MKSGFIIGDRTARSGVLFTRSPGLPILPIPRRTVRRAGGVKWDTRCLSKVRVAAIAIIWEIRMHRLLKWLVVYLLCSVPLGLAEDMTEGRLMRFPDVYKDKLVFSYGGDLWFGSASGGVARRITSHPGLELFPKFSPDGNWIAFTGQYDGNFNVYVIPSEGGEPKQLTFLPDVASVPERMGPNNMVITWFPDSKRILFLSRRDTYNTWFGRLFSVSIAGGLPERFPIDKGGLTSFCRTVRRSPTTASFATSAPGSATRAEWRRISPSMTPRTTPTSASRIGDPGTQIPYPMWHGDTISLRLRPRSGTSRESLQLQP